MSVLHWCRNSEEYWWQLQLGVKLFYQNLYRMITSNPGSSDMKPAALPTVGIKRHDLHASSTLLRGRAWASFEVLTEEQTDTYAHLKGALLARLSPDTDEDRVCA